MKYLRFLIVILGLVFNTTTAIAAGSYFCPKGNQMISLGMTDTQVASACGTPMSKDKDQGPALEKVPVQQIIYNEADSTKVFYGYWRISHGINHGHSVIVSVIDNKIVQIQMDGNTVNAVSFCEGGTFSIGDNVNNVYGACGTPTTINETYIRRRMPGVKKPETWIYQFGQYQSPLKLQFQGGKLIDISGGN